MMFEMLEISKSFGGIKVLQGVNLTIEKGERIGLSGGNGAGKSTLLNIATGFISADLGKIFFDGNEISKLPAWKFPRLGIRRSFQDTRMHPTLTIKEQFFVKKHIVRDNMDLVRDAGLLPFLDLFPIDVPLPVLRKVEVVRALLSRPKLICLDEPSAGFSTEELSEFAIFLKRFVCKNTSLIIVEHRLDLIKEVADTTYELVSGVATKWQPK